MTRVLDAGCGAGRNLVYFLRNGFDIFGIDSNPNAIASVHALAAQLAPELPLTNFTVAEIDDIPATDGQFDAVLGNAVLHFAEDQAQFDGMLNEMWRVLKTGGLFFARLASNIGIESQVTQVAGRRSKLPDGTMRFLVDEAMLLALAHRLGGRLLDPIKTTNVQNLRCMTTWCMQKQA